MTPLYIALGADDPLLFRSKDELLKDLKGELIDEHFEEGARRIITILQIDDDLTSVSGRWENVSVDLWKEAEPLANEYLREHYRAEYDELVAEKEADGTFEAYLVGRLT